MIPNERFQSMTPATKAKTRTKASRPSGLAPILATTLLLVGIGYAVSLFQ
jgi:hypothetical protein